MRLIRPFAILFLLAATLLLAAPISAQGAKPIDGKGVRPANPAAGKIIPGQYIVVLKSGSNVQSLLNAANVKPLYTYNAALTGFAAKLSDSAVAFLSKNPLVDYIEPDQIASIDTTQTIGSGGPWGLDRIDQRNRPLSGTYTYNSSGSGVTAYIIDTGIQTSHPDFGGRAAVAYDALGGNGQDCNGHGTHVSGTVGGSTYGVAKSVRLRAVRVLDCSGSGTYSQIIAGVNWVRTNAAKPAVANMSLGGGYSSALNTAVTNLANAGIFIAVAAGNSNANACNYSPSSASGTFTTAASDINDAKASFSNYGGCVDAYAPGVNIKSDWLSSGTNTISGTSMASPHVAGLSALYKSRYGDAASSTIVTWIINNSTANVISGNRSGTPNRLIFSPAP